MKLLSAQLRVTVLAAVVVTVNWRSALWVWLGRPTAEDR
jgi:hypothetical protein